MSSQPRRHLRFLAKAAFALYGLIAPGTTVTAIERPALVAPVDGTRVSHRDPLVFNWMPVHAVKEYRLEVDRSHKGVFTPAFRQRTPGTSLAAPSSPLGAGTYRWRVVALDSRDAEAPSEWRSFILY